MSKATQNQSLLTPTLPILRKPKPAMAITRIMLLSPAQKLALYPSKSELLVLRVPSLIDFFDITPATTAPISSPTLFPSCVKVLKTPPAKACVSGGNISVITKLPIVNRQSAATGMKSMDTKIPDQYVHVGGIKAMIRKAAAEMIVVTRTMVFARILCTAIPVMMLVTTPVISIGMKRGDVDRGDRCCTS